MKKYGHIIAKLRKEKGLTQEQLGKMLNVSYQAVSKWENDLAEPSLDTLDKLVKIFDLTIADFFNLVNGEECLDNKEYRDVQKKRKNFLNIFISKPWYLVTLLCGIVIILSLCAFLIPVKVSSKQVYNNYNTSVFYISAEGNSIKKNGTGFFINNSGLAITTLDNLLDCTSGSIKLYNGNEYNIEKIVSIDTINNIAVIEVDITNTNSVKLGNSNNISMGDKVYSITYADEKDSRSVVSEGFVYKVEMDSSGVSSFQTTATIENSNAGGVVFNESGKAIGLISGQLKSSGVKFDFVNVCTPLYKVNQIDKKLNVSLQEFYDMCKSFYFYSDGRVIERKEFISGDLITQIDDPEKIGYIFEGWYCEDTFKNKFDFSKPVTNQTACYARWKPINYVVKFDANGGEGQMDEITVYYDEEFLLPVSQFYYQGFKSIGWYINRIDELYEENTRVKNLTTENDAVIMFKVRWEIIEYTIHFDGNNSHNGEMSDLTLKYDQVVNLPLNQFSKTGYLFVGWLYNEIVYRDSEEVSKLSDTEETIILQAQWKPIEYTIRFVYEQESYEQNFTYDKPQKIISKQFYKTILQIFSMVL